MLKRVETDLFTLAGHSYRSRLWVGTGKYRNLAETKAAIRASGAEVVTFAVRRIPLASSKKEPHLLDSLPPSEYTLLPNTAGCYTAEDAVRTALLARDLLEGHDLIKLEVLGDEKTLLPHIPETIKATQILLEKGFKVLVYTNDDPVMAKQFEQMGCTAVMPLAAPIGSGLGIRNPYNIRLIVENASVPIIVDAGVGTASDATIALELGCDAVLMNTAIAGAQNPILMASAMKKAVEAGREAFCAGRIPCKRYGSASSPEAGLFF
ncbi:MAG: thiazole synthase [Gammaproteobacteria bacterium]|nr:thiazole synthase [Gammaproteobacteria bacterium]